MRALTATNLEKTYPPLHPGAPGLTIFRGLQLSVEEGEMVAIVGQSGSGKSTLLHVLGALDTPSAGEIVCGGTRVDSLTAHAAAAYRNRYAGYVWQMHHLLPEFTALENVALPLMAAGTAKARALQSAAVLLERVGLRERASHLSGELSGGEQQRVALARALVTRPQILLADEPTGNLDAVTAEAVFQLLRGLQQERQLTCIVVTHNADFADRCDRVLHLRDGVLQAA